MKPESLEALILDRALGELSPEATELLEEHLANNPALAGRAAALAATVVSARQLTHAQPVSPRDLPPLKLAVLARQSRARSMSWRWSSLAACLALGLIAGWTLKPAREPAGSETAPVRANPTNVAAPLPPPRSPSTPLASAPAGAAIEPGPWPARILARTATETKTATGARYRLRWTSPGSKPSLENTP